MWQLISVKVQIYSKLERKKMKICEPAASSEYEFCGKQISSK